MAFSSGNAANEYELQEKLNEFILSIDGWSKITQADEFDSVYFSRGSDGYNDIYIRAACGLTENPAYFGAAQRDFGDGYVGFVNFFAYQFYPEGGDGYDGYGEAGKLGPMLLHFRDHSTSDLYFQSINSQGSGSNDARRWVSLNDITRESDGTLVEHSTAPGFQSAPIFDGKRKVYFSTTNDALLEWDFASGRALTIDRRATVTDVSSFGQAYYIDADTREEYVWSGLQEEAVSYRSGADEALDPAARSASMYRWVVNNTQGQGFMQTGFTGPMWSKIGGSYGIDSVASSMIWDGHNNLYCARGSESASGLGTDEWAKYHIPTDSWIVFTTATAPVDELDIDYRLPALPAATSTSSEAKLVWVDKITSGYSHHRIYTMILSTNLIYFINIDEDSGIPVGSWTSAGSPPATISFNSLLFHNRLDRFFWRAAGGTRAMYTAKFKESGSLSWTLVDANYYPSTISGTGVDWYVDGYASRVRTSLYESTKYWFFGSVDHITVATKADGKYSFCYMGSVAPFALRSPAAKTVNHTYPGSSVEIDITGMKGEFLIGQRMYISDSSDDAGGSYIGDVDGVERKIMPIEKFTITSVDVGISITADSISNNYTPGSRIGFDPQPVGITMDGLDKIQMLNSINTTLDHGALEPAFNIAKLDTAREEVVNASGGDDRRDLYALWPVLILNQQDDDTNLVGTEMRGSLIGIFAASGTGELVSEDTILVGGNTYIVLDVETVKTFKYVFGPINN